MKKYKLVDINGYTRRYREGETYWFDGLEKKAVGKGNKLCTNAVIHWYDYPLLAVLFNPIHTPAGCPRLIEIKIDKEVAHDGLKGGCKKATFIREIKLPFLSLEQRVAFAIKTSLKVYKDESYKKWANDWLSGKDRSEVAAADAARAASISVAGAGAARAAAFSVSAIREVAGLPVEKEVAWVAENAVGSITQPTKFFIRTISKIVKDTMLNRLERRITVLRNMSIKIKRRR